MARPFADRFAASLCVKPLESRLLLSASTELTLDAGGNLVITDVAGHADNLTIQLDGDKYIISDLTSEIGLGSGDPGNIAAHATVIDEHTIEIDAASVGDQIIANLSGGTDEFSDTLTLEAGIYNTDLVLGSPITLLGANEGINPNVGGRGDESTLNGSIFVVTAGSVEIDGFEINGSIVDPGADLLIENNIIVSAGTGVDLSGANSAIVQNNAITAGGDGIFGQDVTTTVTIVGNTITLTGPGTESGIRLDRIGGDVSIGGPAASDGNTIGGSLTYGVIASELGGTFTAQNNEITAASEVGIEVASFDGNATITGNTIASTIASDSLGQGIHVSNFGYVSLASATIQGNAVEVEGGGIWVESVQGIVQIGGANPGDGNTIIAGGRGILLLAYGVMGAATVENNTIESGSGGIEFEGGVAAFTATGNAITASFEAGIRVHDSTGNITIGGPAAADQNTITVTSAFAGIAVTQVSTVGPDLVTIQGNDITSDENTSYAIDAEAIVGNLVVVGNHITHALDTTLLVGLNVDDVTGDVTVQSNTIEGEGLQGMQVTNVTGTAQIGGAPDVDGDHGNTVDGLALGIDVGDSPNVIIEFNTVTASIRGIYAYTIDSLIFANNAVAITDAGTGVVFDGQAGATNVDFGTGNTIAGGDSGLLMLGADVALVGNTLSDLDVSGQAVAHIALAETAFVGQKIDGTGVLYDGVLGEAATLAEGFVIEDKIIHAIDDDSVGFVRIQTGNLFVTPNSFVAPYSESNIQRAINVADAGDTVFVQAGMYNGNLTIDRPLTLNGPNEGISAVTGGRVEEAIVFGTITIATPGNVVIDGFTLDESVVNDGPSSLANGGPELTVQNNLIDATTSAIDISLVNSALILNNQIGSQASGIVGADIGYGLGGLDDSGEVTIQGNSIVAADRGIDLDHVKGMVFIGGVGTEKNTIFNGNYGIVAHELASTFTAQENEITGFAVRGIEVATFDDEVLLLGNTLVSQTFAPPDTVTKTGGIYVSNLTHTSAAGVTLQDNFVEVDELGIWLESVQGAQQIGGIGPGEGNTIDTFAGIGVLIQANGVGGAATLQNNQITAGGIGVSFQDGSNDFTASGNTIVAVFAGGMAPLEAALLVQNSTAGNILIGGPDPADGNAITVVEGFAGVEVLNLAENLTIQNNVITAQSNINPNDPDPDDPVDSTSIYVVGVGGTTTIQRNLLDGSELRGVDISDLVGTVTIGGLMSGGSISVDAENEIEITEEAGYLTPGIDAGVSTILLMANQDDLDAEGFTQASAAPIVTVNNTADAIKILVGGTGDAAISVLMADTIEDPDILTVGTITVDVTGGAILDNRIGDDLGVDTNIIAHTAILRAETGIGDADGGDASMREDIDTAVSFLTGETATNDIDVDELDAILLGDVWAYTGRIWVNAHDGEIDLLDGTFLLSATGKVSNAPPILILAEANPADVILPGDPTQEVVGYIGGDALLDEPGENTEFGVNFTIEVTWDDGIVSTLNLRELGFAEGLQAGDTLVWIVGEDGSTTTLERLPEPPESLSDMDSPTGAIGIFIQRVYPLAHLQAVSGTEIFATFVIHNDAFVEAPGGDETVPKSIDYFITLTDQTSNDGGRSLNRTEGLTIASALAEEGFGQVVIAVEEVRALATDDGRLQSFVETLSVLPGQTNIYNQAALADEGTGEEQAVLFLVRVGPDGKETNRVLLPLSDLRDLNGLLERLRKVPMPSGLYRIYHQEPGLPPRKVLEFRKAGSTIGDPVREPGRGANPVEEQNPAKPVPGGGPAEEKKPEGALPKPAEGAALERSRREQVELALMQTSDDSFTRAARHRRRLQV